MKAPQLDFVKTGDMGGRKIAMGFDENSLEFLQSTLIDLYSDPALAIIREYSTNALDSHIEAGQTRPIEITTPSGLSPYFKVKDYGVGLSYDDVERIYSKYGASTKRETDDQVGMLGLGSKSALTYTNQFTVRAVKNNVVIVVLVSRSETGGAEMTVLDESPTDEPNGVEISIPIKNSNEIIQKCESFFRFWKPGTVLVDGKEPELIPFFEVSDRIKIVSSSDYYNRPSYVVMGNVPYLIDWREVNTSLESTVPAIFPYDNIVAFVDIGEVNFTPNREQLMYTEKTKGTLLDIARDYQKLTRDAIQRDIDGAKSHHDAIGILNKFAKMFYRLSPYDFKYKGEKIVLSFDFDVLYKRSTHYAVSSPSYQITAEWKSLESKSAVAIVNYPGGDLSSYRKAQLYNWGLDNDLHNVNFYLCDKMSDSPWSDGIKTYDWQDILDTKLDRKKSGPKLAARYPAYINGFYKEVEDFDSTIPLVYAGRVDAKDRNLNLQNLFKEEQVALLSVNRIDKFKVKYPSSRYYLDVLKDRVNDFINGLTDEDRIAISLDWRVSKRVRELDSSLVDDPKIRMMIDTSKAGNSDLIKKHTNMMDLGYKINAVSWEARYGSSESSDYLKKYPLFKDLDTFSVLSKEHAYRYLNDIYNSFYKNEENE